MAKRCVLTCEINAAFRFHYMTVEERLLPGIEQCERTTLEFVIVPHLRCAHLEFIAHLRMYARQVFERLAYAVARVERSPALGIFGPCVTGEDNTPPCFAPIIWVVDHT